MLASPFSKFDHRWKASLAEEALPVPLLQAEKEQNNLSYFPHLNLVVLVIPVEQHPPSTHPRPEYLLVSVKIVRTDKKIGKGRARFPCLQ